MLVSNEIAIAPVEAAALRIRVVRGARVILDEDLADLYGVETRALSQSVRRNADRFPADFMFELGWEEWTEMRRIAGDDLSRGGRRKPPLAFTEQGVAMLSGVLRSPRAVAVNIQIMRAFVRLREILAENAGLSSRLDEMEHRYDEQFAAIMRVIQALTAPSVKRRRPLGFRADDSVE